MQWLCLEKDARRPFPASPSTARDPPKLGCWSAPSLLAGERPRAALTCEGYAEPNTPACVLSLAVARVRLFAAPVEAGYVTSSALLSRPPSQRALEKGPPRYARRPPGRCAARGLARTSCPAINSPIAPGRQVSRRHQQDRASPLPPPIALPSSGSPAWISCAAVAAATCTSQPAAPSCPSKDSAHEGRSSSNGREKSMSHQPGMGACSQPPWLS